MIIFTVSRITMSWKIALLVALITAIATAIVTAPVAEKVTGMHGVSDFEGKRGYAIVFLFIPAGFVGGFLLGLLGTKLAGAVEWVQFWKALGLSLLLGQVALFGIAGLSLLGIPRPPTVNGRELALEVEVLVPLDQLTPAARERDGLRMSLYAGSDDNRTVPLDTARYREENGMLIVPAEAGLFSRSSTRILSFHIGDAQWLAFDLALPSKPRADSTWSEPAPLRDAHTSGSNTKHSNVMLRYRVVELEKATE